MKKLEGSVFEEPFPHLIVENFYDKKELELIWEELTFYTKPGKLLEAKDYGGVIGFTNAKAIFLDRLYVDKYRNMSNILTVNRKMFHKEVMEPFAKLHP